MHILIVDDDAELRAHIRNGLAERGIHCSEAVDGEQALRALAERKSGFDLILLDVMLPARSGWDLLQAIRSAGHETPVIFVSALDAVEERVKGLQLGADDYVVKPFALDELVARIETVLRRYAALVPVGMGDIKLDIARRRVTVAGNLVEVSPREFDLLLALVRAQGGVLSRADLLRDVWGIEHEPGTNLVDVHVGRLRKRLEPYAPGAIRTVRGQGYRLDTEVLSGAASEGEGMSPLH
jgi:two-component system copper resistance phosphate regulon response regulator CusR